MIRPVHDELDTAGDRAELPDDQLIPHEREMIEDVALAVLGILWVIVVPIITNNDVRVP